MRLLKNIFMILLVLILVGSVFACKSNDNQVKEEPKEEKEETVDKQEDAEEKIDETQSAITKAEEVGANEEESEELKEAKVYLEEAEAALAEGDFETFNEVIELARQKADIAYNEFAEKKYQTLHEETIENQKQSSQYKEQEVFDLELDEAEKKMEEAEQYYEEGDLANALASLEYANNIYKEVQEKAEKYEEYVLNEYPNLVETNEELKENDAEIYSTEEYKEYNNLIRQIEKLMQEERFVEAAELVVSAKELGKNILLSTKSKKDMILKAEANRYYTEANTIYNIFKEKNPDSEMVDEIQKMLSKSEEYMNSSKYRLSIENSIEVIDTLTDNLSQSNNGKGENYTVKYNPNQRDCLWLIAGNPDIYGNPFLWPIIWVANLDIIENPDLIFPGQVLFIPYLTNSNESSKTDSKNDDNSNDENKDDDDSEESEENESSNN